MFIVHHTSVLDFFQVSSIGQVWYLVPILEYLIFSSIKLNLKKKKLLILVNLVKEEIDGYNIIVNNPVKEKTSKIF